MRVGTAMLISIIVGSLIGFGVSYFYFSVQIQNLQSQVSAVNLKFYGLNTTVNGLENMVSNVENDLTNTQDNLSNTVEDIYDLSSSMERFEITVDNLQGNLLHVESNLSETQTDISTLNSSLISMSSGNWNIVESLTGTYDKYLTFQLKGEKVRICWSMDGQSPSSWIDIKIYYSNGTLWQSAGSSGIFGIFENEADLDLTGEFILWIRV